MTDKILLKDICVPIIWIPHKYLEYNIMIWLAKLMQLTFVCFAHPPKICTLIISNSIAQRKSLKAIYTNIYRDISET